MDHHKAFAAPHKIQQRGACDHGPVGRRGIAKGVPVAEQGVVARKCLGVALLRVLGDLDGEASAGGQD